MPGKLLHNRQPGKKKKKEQTRDQGEKRCYILYGLGFFEISFTMNDILENAIIWGNE